MTTKIFSFFSGCGLLDLGFEKAGHDVVFVNEYFAPFLDAYKYSRDKLKIPTPKYGYSLDSIEDILAHTQSPLYDAIKAEQSAGHIVGFIGGPPCPDFSVGGKNRGATGENGKLSSTYADLIIKQQPDFFLFENVKGLWRTKKHREFYDSLKKKLERSGYVLFDKLINSIEFGAPQDRERIILLGFKKPLLKNLQLTKTLFPWDKYADYSDKRAFHYKWPSTHDFAQEARRNKPADIPEELTVEYWFKKNNVESHPNGKHYFQPRAGLERFLSVDEGDDSKKSFKRLHRWRYSPTACYGNNEVHLHPYKARRISAAEALAIQSLPAEFELPENMSLTNMFKTIGNGVPFLAANKLALTINDFLTGNAAELKQAS